MTKPAKPADIAADFRSSRVYAQGWNAARMGQGKKGGEQNPYASEPDRTRWLEGWTAAGA